MLPVNSIALKEWAVVCAGFARGEQSILLRKGGIRETNGVFQLERPEFWLWPTAFHQQADSVTSAARLAWDDVQWSIPPVGRVQLSVYAVVEQAWKLTDEEDALALSGLHLLSETVVRQRFQYREPGLNVLALRVYRIPTPHEFIDTPEFAGCKSWVELPQAFSTAGAEPVVSDVEHAARMALAGTRGTPFSSSRTE